MPKPKKKAMELVDSCRTPTRRKIMLLASEAEAKGSYVTAKGLQSALGFKGTEELSRLSYHVRALWEAGALECIGGEQIRGAYQKQYVPSKAFQASMTDTIALDQIAELIDSYPPKAVQTREKLIKLVRATGRPVEA